MFTKKTKLKNKLFRLSKQKRFYLKLSLIPLILLLISYINFSCALKETKSPSQSLTCGERFYKVIEYGNKDINYKIKGRIKGKGIFLVFKGIFSKASKIDLFLPFGSKFGSIDLSEAKELCLKYKEETYCSLERDFVEKVLGVSLPFSLKEIITAHYKIKPELDYHCKDGNLIINYGDFNFLYKDLKPEEVRYKEYKILYFYKSIEDKIPSKIEIYKNNRRELRIKITDFKI